MFSKKEFAIVSNLRFISRTISCSSEVSMKSFITLGPDLQTYMLTGLDTLGWGRGGWGGGRGVWVWVGVNFSGFLLQAFQ